MEGDRVRVGPVTKQVVKSNDPHGGQGLLWVSPWTSLHFLNIVILHLSAYEDETVFRNVGI